MRTKFTYIGIGTYLIQDGSFGTIHTAEPVNSIMARSFLKMLRVILSAREIFRRKWPCYSLVSKKLTKTSQKSQNIAIVEKLLATVHITVSRTNISFAV